MINIRASALSDFFDCPARAEAKHLLGMKMPGSPKAALGTAIHKSTAAFDQSTLDDAGFSIGDTAGLANDSIFSSDNDVDWKADDSLDRQSAADIAIALHTRYCLEIAPSQSYAAVEVQCERLEITDLGIALQGTTDRIRKTDDGYAVSDLKSGGSAVSSNGDVPTKGAAYQIGVYELLAERASGLPITDPAEVIGLQTGKTDKGQRVAISKPIVGARDVLLGDNESPGVLEIVSKMIKSGSFPGNPRSMLCGERWCPIYNRCKFRL